MKHLLVFQHIAREHPSTIAEYAAERGIGVDIVRTWESDAVPPLSGYDAVIVLGGPMGVADEYPGKREEVHAIRNAIGVIPTLGICLGAQLIANALGARVYPMAEAGGEAKEIGYYDMSLTDDGKRSPLFKGFSETFSVLQWHGDTFDLPEDAELLASARQCKSQAFSYGTTYGIQFHLEPTPGLIDEWLTEDAAWINEGFALDEEKIRRESRQRAPQMKEDCYRLMDNLFAV